MDVKIVFGPLCILVSVIMVVLFFNAMTGYSYLLYSIGVSVCFLIIVGLFVQYFFATIDVVFDETQARIQEKEKYLKIGKEHLLREIFKQLEVLEAKDFKKSQSSYQQELMKELAVVTRHLEA